MEAVEHDLALLKKAVRHVIPDITMRSTHVVTTEVDTGGFFPWKKSDKEGKMNVSKEILSNISGQVSFPEVDWENEVNSIMITDRDSDEEGSSQS